LRKDKKKIIEAVPEKVVEKNTRRKIEAKKIKI